MSSLKINCIFPKMKDCITCPWTNRREMTVISGLHIGHSYVTYFLLWKGEEPPMCVACDERLFMEHIFFLLVLFR